MEHNFDISKLTSFKIGGSVEKVYFPTSADEFVEILKREPEAKVFGNLSNTLISSYGYDGAVVLTTKMETVSIDGSRVYAECGIKGPKLSQMTEKAGLSGFEFMIGFPGSLGGNVCMNASAHGQCISDRLVSVTCFDGKEVVKLNKDDMKFSYRHSRCSDENMIVLAAEFDLLPSDRVLVKKKMDENLEFRRTHQPSLALPNCGSVFKNPEGDSAGRLLDSVGAKSMCEGGVKVWENHANFIVNTDGGSSIDVLRLMKKMTSAVKEQYNIKLIPEIKFLGNKNKEEVDLWLSLK